MTSAVRRNLLERLIKSGLQVTPDALEFIMNQESPKQVVESLISEWGLPRAGGVLISREHVQSCIFGPASSAESGRTPADTIRPDDESGGAETLLEYSGKNEHISPLIEILKNPTLAAVGSAGTVDDFLSLFTDRFQRVKRMYMGRVDTRGAVPIEMLKQKRGDARHQKRLSSAGVLTESLPSYMIIGMVKSKSVSRSGNVIVELEDAEGSVACVIPAGKTGPEGRELLETGNSILLDEVVCVSGRVDQDGRMIANSVIFPDVPQMPNRSRARRVVYAAFISDMHCGSLHFLEDEFDKFIDWIAGRDLDGSTDESLVEKIEYLFIAGDLCDGVGVYPGQEEDLGMKSIRDQYAHLADKMRRIPERIKILCIPGNHDACRQALPRPPIPEDFAGPLYEFGERMLMMGDPCQVRIEGVNILITHGDSLDDLTTQLPGVTYEKPELAMKALLRKRHLAPVYGGKTELAPLARDWMVIDNPPDIVHFGHAHHNACDNYRGVQIINSGCFQKQTDFMRKQGIKPTPGIVTVVNLATLIPDLRLFYEFGTSPDGENQGSQ